MSRSSINQKLSDLTGARYEFDEHLDINAGIKLGLIEPEDDVSILYGLVLKF